MSAGKLFIGLGLLFLIIGGIIIAAEKLGLHLGRLPGDIIIKKENFTLYLPIATSLLLSALLTLVLWLFRK